MCGYIFCSLSSLPTGSLLNSKTIFPGIWIRQSSLYNGNLHIGKTEYFMLRRPPDGLLAWHVKVRVAQLPGMPGLFSPPPRVSEPDMHHAGTCVTHVPWCMPESLTSGFHWSGSRVKRSLHFRRMYNTQFYVSGKRPMLCRWQWFVP